MSETRYDVLVAGGGLAGLVAASRAAELGGQVLLLDKSGSALGDGNTLTTTGVYYTAGVSRNSSPDELYSRARAGGRVYPELASAWADNCRRALEWLESVGVSVDKSEEGDPQLESKSSVSMAPVYRVDVGTNIAKKLRAFFHDHHGVSMSRTKAVKLVTKGGKVMGIESIGSDGNRLRVSGGATVLATGGFQANGELLRKYVGRHADGCKLMGSAAATGDGLKMAVAVGARAVNLQFFYGRMVSSRSLTDDRLWPYPTMATLVEDGIMVNRNGKRFFDEGWGDIPLANTVARWDDVASAYLVFDEVAWERSKGDVQSLVAPNPWLMEKDGGLCKAESLSELANKLGINGKNFETTVQEFNRAAAKRRLGEMAVPRINNARALNSPFYGLKVVPGIISTMGGPLIDKRASVLNNSRKPIPGLYAAGDVVGGLMGGRTGGYVGGISQAAVTGLLAGENAHKYATM